MNPPYSSLAQSARAQELKKAKGILWFIGLLTIGFNIFMFVKDKNELDNVANTMRSVPAAQRAEFDKAYADASGKIRLIYGASIALGVIFVVCALCVDRKPVASTVTGLVLYLANVAVLAAIEPKTIPQGIIIKIFIIVGLVSSVKAALAIEKERRAEAAG